MAAMIYADVLSVMDLILLTSVVDNRREIMKLKKLLNRDYENVQIQFDVESLELNKASVYSSPSQRSHTVRQERT